MEIKRVNLLNQKKSDLTFSIGSGGVIIRDNKVLLVRGRGGDKFKFPGGHIEDQETLMQAAEREIEEEIACNVTLSGDPLFYFFQPDEQLNIILVHYKAEIISGEPTASTEIEEIKWFDIDQLPSNCFDNVYQIITELQSQDLSFKYS